MARPDLSRRAELKNHPERMDGPCSYEEMRKCLQDIARVNRLTRAYRPTLEFLERLVAIERGRKVRMQRELRIVDAGSGYGDMLRIIENWARSRGIAVSLLGVDWNPHAVRAAREATAPGSGIRFVAGDIFSCAEAQEADVAISSLLTHHLEEADIVRFLRWMEQAARLGWFVNDLRRQAVPYYAFRALAAAARWHPFVRHDGPVSILRSFVSDDWQRICRAAALDAAVVEIGEHRPARLCVERIK